MSEPPWLHDIAWIESLTLWWLHEAAERGFRKLGEVVRSPKVRSDNLCAHRQHRRRTINGNSGCRETAGCSSWIKPYEARIAVTLRCLASIGSEWSPGKAGTATPRWISTSHSWPDAHHCRWSCSCACVGPEQLAVAHDRAAHVFCGSRRSQLNCSVGLASKPTPARAAVRAFPLQGTDQPDLPTLALSKCSEVACGIVCWCEAEHYQSALSLQSASRSHLSDSLFGLFSRPCKAGRKAIERPGRRG